jgi:hypothetical protein
VRRLESGGRGEGCIRRSQGATRDDVDIDIFVLYHQDARQEAVILSCCLYLTNYPVKISDDERVELSVLVVLADVELVSLSL